MPLENDDARGGDRPKRPKGPLAFRILRTVCVAALAGEAFYLVAMNVFLSTPLFEKAIDATPDVVDIHYIRGWSFFPTRIHARGLSIRGTDSHVEWILRFDEIEFDCKLLELVTKKEFHVTRARGNGITFRARMKVAAPEATPEHLEWLPPIDSLGPVGIIPSLPPYPGEWDDSKWHLWTVRIDDAIAEHTREVWVEGGRFQGDARITGQFLLKPMRDAYVGPAHVEVRSGSASLDARVVAEPLAASVDFELTRFDPRTAAGVDILHRITLSLDAKGEIPDLDNLSLTLPDSGQVHGKVEVPRLAIRLVKGVVSDETHVDAHGESLRVTTASHAVSGGIDLAADVTQGKLLAAASVEHLDADFTLSIPRLSVSADSAALGFDDPFADLHGVLDVPDASLSQAARLMGYLPKGAPLRIVRGALHGSLHAEGWRADERVRGNASVRAKDLDAIAGKLRVRGEAEVDASVASFRFDTRRATDARVAIAVPEGAASPSLSPGEPFLRVRGLHASAKAAHVDVDHPLRSLRVYVAVPDAELFDRESARAAFGLGPDLRLASRRARFAATADVAIQGDRVSGEVTARAPGVEIEYARGGASALHIAGDVKAVADVARWDMAKKTLGGDLELTVEDVTGRFDSRATVPDFGVNRIDVRASVPALDLQHPSMRDVDYGLRVGRADLVDARALNRFLPSPKILAVESGRALVSADIGTTGSARAASGRLDLSLLDGGIRLRQTHLAGDFTVVLHAHSFDPDAATVDMDGSSIAMRNVRVTGASTDTSAWSGDLMLQTGVLGLAGTPKLEGDLTLEARDASPILGVLFRDTLPKFVAELTRMPSFTAATHIVIEPDRLVVSDLMATGGDLSLRGTYVAHEGDRDAAFVVQKGPWSVGVSLDNDGSHLRLFGLKSWYAEHSREALAPR